MSRHANHDRPLGRRVARAAAVAFGLLVALLGLAITRDECEVACGTAADRAFRESMGYAALVLGAFSVALALRGRPGLAAVVSSIGAVGCFAAFVEAVSHLS